MKIKVTMLAEVIIQKLKMN